jgi:DnaK suppressor protein
MNASTKLQKKSDKSSDLEGDLDPDYVPTDAEEFMNEKQLRYFELQLLKWRGDILEESRGTLNNLQDGPIREPDLNDRASSETDWGIEREYGYCQVTGEPISLARLRARPIATMTLEAQERHERQERVSRDD